MVLILGWNGFRIHLQQENRPADFFDLTFRACQLFFMQAGVAPPIPWQLNAARYLAPLIAAYTALQALARLFAEQTNSLRLRFLRSHVVVCGLGRKGFTLACGFLDQGRTVVIIERDAENDLVTQSRDLGAIVLFGDAAETWLLRKVGAARAAQVIAVCGDDGVNAEIAVRLSRLVGPAPVRPVNCYLHILDPRLCLLLRQRDLTSSKPVGVRLDFFNVYELGARILLSEHAVSHPVREACAASHPMVIVGMGALGQCLLLQAARRWHGVRDSSQSRLPVTLVDQRAREIADTLNARYPALKGTCDITPLEMDVRTATFHEAAFLDGAPKTAGTVRLFICLDDDSLSLSAALALVHLRPDRRLIITARMAREEGLAALLRDREAGHNSGPELHAFGLLDRTCHPDLVLGGTRETLARAMHEAYVSERRSSGFRPSDNPSMVPWDQLPEHIRETNRQEADGIGAKLAAVHCTISPMIDWDRAPLQFTAAEVELLARMEHERWMSALQRDGWCHGPAKDAQSRTHPCLVPFEQLPPEQQDKDRDAVRGIPALLSRVGFLVQRLPSPA